MNTIGLERRMTRLARLYAARQRRFRHIPSSSYYQTKLCDAIDRTKLNCYAAESGSAMALLAAAMAADCLSQR